ncbi:apolipoprotein A1/A4/E family protein [Bacillus toyonensis]|uniref:apolipoprotein A1/A4/E family protein n=1 Tax=Bacillus toyonensis TaxID=155322 RepID=UPI0021004F82|nr:apolipoprotein A1/A4/E family protein [Bacillus toyonensis]
MQAIIAGITIAAAGMTPALLGGLGAVASLFGTAGIAAAGFGALAFTTFTKTIEKANDLEQAHLKANAALIAGDTKGYAKAMAMVQAIMESMSEEERQAVVSINALKDAWADMEDKMTPTTLKMIAESTTFLRLTMTKLFPAFQGVGESFTGMIKWMNQAIEQGKADKFFEHMNTFAVPMFEKVMKSAGNILNGFAGIMVAFTPLGMQLGDGMVDLTKKFADWAWGLQSNPAFQDFVKMVQESTPVIMELIGQIVSTLWQLIQGLYPVSIQILQLAADFLKWAQDSGALKLAIEAVSGVVQFFLDNMNALVPILVSVTAGVVAANVAFKAMMIVRTLATGIQLLATMLGLSRVATAAGTTAQWALNAAMWANPIGILIGLIVALIAVGVLLYQNWDEVKKYCEDMWKLISFKYEEGKKKVIKAYDDMVASVKQWWSDTKKWWSDTVQAVEDKAKEMKDKVAAKYEEIKGAIIQKLTDILTDNAQKWEDLKKAASDKVQAMKQAVIDKYNQMKTDAENKLKEIVNDTKRKFDEMVQAAKDKVSDWGKAAGDMLKEFGSGIKNGFVEAKYKVIDGVNGMVDKFTGFFTTFYRSGKGLLGEFINGITSGFGDAARAVSRGMSSIRAYLPFSPAKKGPLSDLDKSGKAFFPTWYEAALTQVGTMERSMGRAFGGVANQAQVALAGTGLEAFTGGRTSVTVNHVVKVDGTVGLDSKGVEEFEQRVTQQVVNTSGGGYGGMDYSGLNQSIRKL